MSGLFDFIIKPLKSRYNNTKKVGDKELIINSQIFTHQNVSRNAIVIALPKVFKTDIEVGDEVIVHHNIFRRFHDVRGDERNSKSYFEEDKYFCQHDQLFLYKQNGVWKGVNKYCFVKPLENDDLYSTEKEKPFTGIIKYSNDFLNDRGIKVNDLVGFRPGAEYEFVIENERLYRVPTQYITIKYEYQGKEKEYNPSWL